MEKRKLRLMEFSPYWNIDIEKIEKSKGAKFIGNFCIKDKNQQWTDFPVCVFYQYVLQDPNHSHYFGVYVKSDGVYICKADSGVADPLAAVISKDGEVLWSQYRHDYRRSEDGSVFIDGGRDYWRSNTRISARVHIVKDTLQIEEIPREITDTID